MYQGHIHYHRPERLVPPSVSTRNETNQPHFNQLLKHPFAKASSEPLVGQFSALSELLLSSLSHFPDIAEIVRTRAPIQLRDKAHSSRMDRQWLKFSQFVQGDSYLSQNLPTKETLWRFRKNVHQLETLQNITIWKAWFDLWCTYPHLVMRPPVALVKFKDWLDTQPILAQDKISQAARDREILSTTWVKITPKRLGGLVGISITGIEKLGSEPYILGFAVSEIPTPPSQNLISPEQALSVTSLGLQGIPARILKYDVSPTTTHGRSGHFTRLVSGLGPIDITALYERIKLKRPSSGSTCDISLIAPCKISSPDITTGKATIPKHLITPATEESGMMLYLPQQFFMDLRKNSERLRFFVIPYNQQLTDLLLAEHNIRYNLEFNQRDACFELSTETFKLVSVRDYSARIVDHTGNRLVISSRVGAYLRGEISRSPTPYPIRGRLTIEYDASGRPFPSPFLRFAFLGTSFCCPGPSITDDEVTIQPRITERRRNEASKTWFDVYHKDRINGSPIMSVGPYNYKITPSKKGEPRWFFVKCAEQE